MSIMSSIYTRLENSRNRRTLMISILHIGMMAVPRLSPTHIIPVRVACGPTQRT